MPFDVHILIASILHGTGYDESLCINADVYTAGTHSTTEQYFLRCSRLQVMHDSGPIKRISKTAQIELREIFRKRRST